MNDKLNDRSITAANMGFASGGLTPRYRGKLRKLGALCFYSSVAQFDSFVLRNPPTAPSAKMI